MMFTRHVRLGALLCLCLGSHAVLAGVLARDGTTAASSTTVAPSSTASGRRAQATTSTSTEHSSTDISTFVPDSSTVAVEASSTSSLVIPTSTTGSDSLNSTLANMTIPAGELPIQPSVTPGWGVAGTILLISGAVYAVIGIKLQWLHAFFSTAYLAALGTTVLILYVMNPPVSLAIQGAYVVAIVCTGAILGGLAVVFADVTECMACLLGGFSLSMWLLALKDGGLLQDTVAKVIFIIAFTVFPFALYFSRYTRVYSLMASISFSGATTAILGIDCFSRAGLKEFWAYIWNLNQNLFPYGADTYPVTRGIRVELALTIIIFIAGVIAQLKMWTMLKKHRERKYAEQEEVYREIEEQSERAGRRVERRAARERKQWERVYGEGAASDGAPGSAADSGVSGLADEKMDEKMVREHASLAVASPEILNLPTLAPGPRTVPAPVTVLRAELPAEATQMPPPSAAEVVLSKAKDGAVTVRVAQDDVPETIPEEDPETVERNVISRRQSKQSVTLPLGAEETTQPPKVVPLPFKVPITVEAEEPEDDSRSSVAAFADDADRDEPISQEHQSTPPTAERKTSLAKRVSTGSANILRSLSQKSKAKSEVQQTQHESQEELIVPTRAHDPDNFSLAANMDDMSSVGDDIETIRDEEEQDDSEATPAQNQVVDAHPSGREAVSGEKMEEGAHEKGMVTKAESGEEIKELPGKAKSVVSVASTPASLSKDKLPSSLSKVALSYRTNEWAKHLAQAEAPAPETLELGECAPEEPSKSKAGEAPAPLNVDELKQTPENGAPLPAAPRSASTMSNYRSSSYGQASRSASALQRRASRQSASAIAEEDYGSEEPRRASEDAGSNAGSGAISASPARQSLDFANRPPVPGIVSRTAPQSLIAQREIMLRNKSYGALVGISMPDVPSYSSSESGSSLHNFPAKSVAAAPASDLDDVPLSQRRQLMRQSSMKNVPSVGQMARTPSMGAYNPQAMASAPAFAVPSAPGTVSYSTPYHGNAFAARGGGGAAISAEALPFDSHQPQRHSTLPSRAARDAQLASFRTSVAAAAGGGRGGLAGGTAGVRQSIDAQRAVLLSRRQAEAEAREAARLERLRGDAAFEARMRTDGGGMLEAHREAMRRMQGGVKD